MAEHRRKQSTFGAFLCMMSRKQSTSFAAAYKKGLPHVHWRWETWFLRLQSKLVQDVPKRLQGWQMCARQGWFQVATQTLIFWIWVCWGVGLARLLRSKGVRKIESAISKKRRKRTHLRDLGYIYILKNTAKLKVKACSPKQVSLIQCNILIAKDKQSNIWHIFHSHLQGQGCGVEILHTM